MSKSSRIVRTDKFPNFMAGKVTQSGADTLTSAQFSTPIPRLQTKGNHATVMELLWIAFDTNPSFNADGENLRVCFYGGQTVTDDTTVQHSNPRSIAYWFQEMGLLTSGGGPYMNSHKINLTSKDGYGYLFAGDVINCVVASSSTGVANFCAFRIYYRFVDIPITEFVGLVQSQQQGTS